MLPSPAEAAAEAVDCCCQLLAADPFCHTAAAALLALHSQHPLPPALLVSGCCTYLEAQPPSWLPPLLELRGEAMLQGVVLAQTLGCLPAPAHALPNSDLLPPLGFASHVKPGPLRAPL